MRPGRLFYCALLLDSELDSNLNCFWPPPRGLEPDQPWTSLLTWKPLLDFIYSIPCTNNGRMHGCHVLIIAASLVLVQVKNKHEMSSPVRPPGVENTSRLRSRDPVASGVKCGPHDGMNSKIKSWMVSWLNLKTKVEPGLHGSRVMSGDWRRLHRVRGVSSCSPENHWVPWLIHKAKTEEPKTVLQRCQTGLTGVR
jgi:hypothetical protein